METEYLDLGSGEWTSQKLIFRFDLPFGFSLTFYRHQKGTYSRKEIQDKEFIINRIPKFITKPKG